MKYVLVLLGCATLAYAEHSGSAPAETHPRSFAAAVAFALLIVVLAVLWAYKNKFTDYP